MELDLYLREADGNHIILHQREKYGDVQVVPLDADRQLRRGGAVMADMELSGMVRGFLNQQGAEKCTLGTAYDKRKLAELTAELADDLGIKLETLAVRVTGLMDRINASLEDAESEGAFGAHDQISGILYALSTLGIPCDTRWNAEKDHYIGVDIAGKTFYVNSGTAAGDGE